MKVLQSGSFNVNAVDPALSMSLTLCGRERAAISTLAFCELMPQGDKLITSDLNDRFTNTPKYRTFNIMDCLNQESGIDLNHIHGTWMYHGLAVSRYAHKTGKPYVISPRGILPFLDNGDNSHAVTADDTSDMQHIGRRKIK